MKTILKTVRIESPGAKGGAAVVESFGPGRESELAARGDVDFARLKAKGAIEGDWGKGGGEVKSDESPAKSK